MNYNNSFRLAVQALPIKFSDRIINLPQSMISDIQEIRLRSARPIVLCGGNCNFYLTENGLMPAEMNGKPITTDKDDIKTVFNNICNYSVYSKQNEIKNGFITIRGGSRAGICGTAVIENGKIANIRDISSINIRIASERLGCADKILAKVIKPEPRFLLCGAPCSGKTTLLRDMARQLSFKYKAALIDSRSELAGTYAGEAQNDIGMCDVLDGYSKADGFDHAVRCLSPEIIICDEIGDRDDALSVENALNSGVAVIASAHCSDRDELLNKPALRNLVEGRAFKNIVFLKSRHEVGRIGEIVTCDELLR